MNEDYRKTTFNHSPNMFLRCYKITIMISRFIAITIHFEIFVAECKLIYSSSMFILTAHPTFTHYQRWLLLFVK